MAEQEHQPFKWSHFSDVPLGSIDDDSLWDVEGLMIRDEIERIADRAVAPLLASDGPPDGGLADGSPLRRSIVYAVHGGWGSGKSSFLRMVAQRARELAGDQANRLVVVHYDASVHQSVEIPPSTTLAMALLERLGGGDQHAAWVFGREGDDDIESVAARLAREVRFPKRIEEELSRDSKTAPGASRVALVLIDELDRCQSEFIYRVLRTVRHWSFADGLVFLLAVNEEPLRRTIEQQASVEAGFGASPYALQKYIQHAVTLPDLTSLQLKPLLKTLLSDDPSLGARAIDEGMLFLQLALRDEEYANPRAVKRCLNAIYPLIHDTITRRLHERSPLDQDEQNRLVKARVLAYRWPDFYASLYYPAVTDRALAEVEALARLERICAQHAQPGRGQDWELVEFELRRLHRLPLDPADLSRHLLSYLSVPPYFALEEWTDSREPGRAGEAAESSSARSRRERNQDAARPPEDEAADDAAGAWPDNGGRSEKTSLSALEGLDLPTLIEPGAQEWERRVRSEFLRLYYEGEGYEATGQRDLALERGRQILKLVHENFDAFRPDDCGSIGNAALTAERFNDYQLAYQLYETARMLNPEHANNLQNYVEFIIDAKVEGLYDFADEMLVILGKGRAARHKPERTLTLQARLGARRGGAISDHQLDHVVEESIKSPESLRTFSTAIAVLQQVNDLARMRHLVAKLTAATSSAEHVYTYRRSLADALALSDENSDECEALDIYRQLASHSPQHGLHADLLSNYAVLLSVKDYNLEAAKAFSEAYRINAESESLRRAFASYLLKGQHAKLLNTVLQGEPLEVGLDDIVAPGGRPLPEGSFCAEPSR